MPCYTVRLLSVEFTGQSQQLLEASARALNWNYTRNGNRVQIGPVTVDLDAKTATTRNQDDINNLKREYSKQAVKSAARAKGWTLDQWKETAGVKVTVATKY